MGSSRHHSLYLFSSVMVIQYCSCEFRAFFLRGWKLGETWFSKAGLLLGRERRGAVSIPRADSPSLFDSLSCWLAQHGLPRQRKAAPPPPHHMHGAGCLSSHHQCLFRVCFLGGIKPLGETSSHAWRRRFSASHLLRKLCSLLGSATARGAGLGDPGSVPVICKQRLLQPGCS